jgi:hypothetical protein
MGHFLAALLGKLCADEVKAWLPSIAKRITRAAVCKLPEEQRERYDEEWSSHLEEVPGPLAKICLAFGFLYTTRQMWTRPRIEASKILFFALLVLVLPIHGIIALLGAWNSRGSYSVPIRRNCDRGLSHITLARIPLGLALRYALNPILDLQLLNVSARHYSVWGNSRLSILEEFVSTRIFHRYPLIGFGAKCGFAPFLPWWNVKIEVDKVSK